MGRTVFLNSCLEPTAEDHCDVDVHLQCLSLFRALSNFADHGVECIYGTIGEVNDKLPELVEAESAISISIKRTHDGGRERV